MALDDDFKKSTGSGVGAPTCISSHSRYALSEAHSGNVYFDIGAAMTVLLRTAEVSDQTGIPVATLRWWSTVERGHRLSSSARKPWFIRLTHWQSGSATTAPPV